MAETKIIFQVGDRVRTVAGANAGSAVEVGGEGTVKVVGPDLENVTYPYRVQWDDNEDGVLWDMGPHEMELVTHAQPVYLLGVVDALGKDHTAEYEDKEALLAEVSTLTGFLHGKFPVLRSIVIKVKE